MNIGLEISAAADRQYGGVYRYIRQLTEALAELRDVNVTLWYRASRFRTRKGWWRPPGLPVYTYQGRWWPPAGRPDLIHGMDAVLPAWRDTKTVATVHDLAVLRSADPEFAKDSFRHAKRKRYADTIQRADRIIAVSETTRQDLIGLLHAAPEKIRIIPHGVQATFRPLPTETVENTLQKYALRPGYLLYVGAISERKNTSRLVRAWARSPARDQWPLVLAGRIFHRSRPTLDAIAELNVADNVRLPGEVQETDLPALYNGAAAFLFPTLYEGFGLPILEAMACGVPVLCADCGGSAEVARDFAVTVDPKCTDAIAGAIEPTIEMNTEQRNQAREYAQSHTWEKCAQQTRDVYRELLS